MTQSSANRSRNSVRSGNKQRKMFRGCRAPPPVCKKTTSRQSVKPEFPGQPEQRLIPEDAGTSSLAPGDGTGSLPRPRTSPHRLSTALDASERHRSLSGPPLAGAESQRRHQRLAQHVWVDAIDNKHQARAPVSVGPAAPHMLRRMQNEPLGSQPPACADVGWYIQCGGAASCARPAMNIGPPLCAGKP